MALTTFRSKRTQLWQYLNTTVDFFIQSVLGKRTAQTPGATATVPVSIEKDDLQTYTLGTTEYDVYKFKGWTVLQGSNAYVVDMGLINVSTGPMLIISNKTNIAADLRQTNLTDSLAIFGGKHVDTIVAVTDPAGAGPYIPVGVASNAVCKSRHDFAIKL